MEGDPERQEQSQQPDLKGLFREYKPTNKLELQQIIEMVKSAMKRLSRMEINKLSKLMEQFVIIVPAELTPFPGFLNKQTPETLTIHQVGDEVLWYAIRPRAYGLVDFGNIDPTERYQLDVE